MPHTCQQIQAFLQQAEIAPRRLWGQHFLIDLNLMRLLVEEARLQGEELVLEVGTGTGSLTELLAQDAGRVVTVEIDARLADVAREQLKSYANVALVQSDVLANKSTIHPEVMAALGEGRSRCAGPLVLVANLPYQVSAPLIIDLLLGEMPLESLAVTVQAEVADRMTAPAGTHQYGSLGILLQATGTVRLVRRLKPTVFWPVPNVYSAIVTWRKDEHLRNRIQDIHSLKNIINLLLGHRRKTIKSCLTLGKIEYDPVQLSDQLQIDLSARAETLPVEKFVQLANRFDSLV